MHTIQTSASTQARTCRAGRIYFWILIIQCKHFIYTTITLTPLCVIDVYYTMFRKIVHLCMYIMSIFFLIFDTAHHNPDAYVKAPSPTWPTHPPRPTHKHTYTCALCPPRAPPPPIIIENRNPLICTRRPTRWATLIRKLGAHTRAFRIYCWVGESVYVARHKCLWIHKITATRTHACHTRFSMFLELLRL